MSARKVEVMVVLPGEWPRYSEFDPPGLPFRFPLPRPSLGSYDLVGKVVRVI